MKKMILTLLPLVACSMILAQKDYTVSNAKELVAAIGPDRTITLKSGDYNLKDAYEIRSDYIYFADAYDGKELSIRFVNNLTLNGNGKVTILAEPRYAWVVSFTDCKDVEMKGIIFGHTEAGYCEGGVLGFTGCSGFKMSNCEMYGSGTEGFTFKESSNMTFNNCEVRKCTYDLMTIVSSSSISFTACTFKDTGEFDLITINSSSNVTYRKCLFSNNTSSEFMPYFFNIDEYSKDITVEESLFKDNKVTKFINDKSRLKQKDNKFEGNAF